MSREPRHALVVMCGGKLATHPLPASGAVTIGRTPDNAIAIEDASISRRHLVLHMGPPLVVEDQGSANGTRIHDAPLLGLGASSDKTARTADGERVLSPGERVEIAPGKVLRVGAATIVVQRVDAEEAPRSMPVGPANVVVTDPVMIALHRTLEQLAESEISVLLLGETGVGKEVLAETIWRRSARADKPMLRLNCAALAETLLESELFGHEKGAFTGAVRAKPGLLESAQGGVVFLDEIGEPFSPATQVKLLRVLEQRQVLRVGGLKPTEIDVRFISATNRDLEREVAAGRFREDLFYRINGFSVAVPPLRERPGEIEPLARAFVAHACRQARRKVPAIAPAATRLLTAYRWPGNVRELRNVMERALVLCGTGEIMPEHLPIERLGGTPAAGTHATMPPPPVEEQPPSDEEQERILSALARCAGNQTRAAKLLGISRGTLVSRLERYAVPRPRK